MPGEGRREERRREGEEEEEGRVREKEEEGRREGVTQKRLVIQLAQLLHNSPHGQGSP